MAVLPEAFFMLTSIGLWKSKKWETWKCILYYSYTLFLAYHFVTFFCFGFLGLILFCTDFIDLITNSSIVITMFTVPGKMITIIDNRKKILNFVKIFDQKEFKPRNEYEKEICNQYDRFISQQSGSLPFKAWYPYNTQSSNIHLFTSYQQVITVFMCANVHVAFDAVLLGMMVQICLQINILKYRFKKMLLQLEETNVLQDQSIIDHKIIEKKVFMDYTKFHSTILSMVDNMVEIFSFIMLVQFFCSSLIFCTSVYVLSQTPVFTTDFLACLVYIICMFFQVFFPCYIGNQMTIEFSELNNALYSTNWYALGTNVRKYMNFIMTKSSKPVVFSTGHIIALSLDAFKNLLKISYTIFNVFQKSS
ncbi:odorant receptor 94a-like [Chelonus insularis]|uniref:odorant receptor 94a-like n=1 Tax=Chelonus insularis TaxID=460826 RepID=UPI00158BB021|nr:odorant receptor 94a-like [Chelonus insularis]